MALNIIDDYIYRYSIYINIKTTFTKSTNVALNVFRNGIHARYYTISLLLSFGNCNGTERSLIYIFMFSIEICTCTCSCFSFAPSSWKINQEKEESNAFNHHAKCKNMRNIFKFE